MEPSRTEYDLHFKLFGLPVRVHPLFWAVSIFLGIHSSTGNMTVWLIMLGSWVAAVFLSILVHELGHALPLARYYGARTWIILHGFGGLACHEPYYRRRAPGTWGTIAYTVAGPFAGFALAAMLLAVLSLCQVEFVLKWESFGDLIFIPYIDIKYMGVFSFLPVYGLLVLHALIRDILYISIFWGLMNLLPLYPLDGGHIARELFLVVDRRNGIANSLWLSFFTGGVIAVLGLLQWVNVHQMQGIPFIPLLFGYLALQSYQMLISSQ